MPVRNKIIPRWCRPLRESRLKELLSIENLDEWSLHREFGSRCDSVNLNRGEVQEDEFDEWTACAMGAVELIEHFCTRDLRPDASQDIWTGVVLAENHQVQIRYSISSSVGERTE